MKFQNDVDCFIQGNIVSLLLAHGTHYVASIGAFVDKNYASDAQHWDVMERHRYVIADALGKGIVKQFPKKF